MKFPKLRCFLTLFLLSWHIAIFAQVVTVPKLTSSLGSLSTITLCNSGTVTFTASGDEGSNNLLFEFMIDRNGSTIFPLGVGSQSASSFSINTLEDGDIVYARVWSSENVGGSALTNSITINLDTYPGAIDFNSNATNNTICSDEMVEFTASSVVSTTLFQYFINGISMQGPSTQTTFTHLISNSSTVTLIARDNSCERSMELFIKENLLQPGSITGGGQFCNGGTPSTITSVNSAIHNGNPLGVLTPNTTYQWESSLDGVNWSTILGATDQAYSPPALDQTTYFRRAVQYNHLGNECEAVSNQIVFDVLPLLNSGHIEQANQFFCSGDALPTLTVSNSTEGGNIKYQWQQSTDAGATYANINLEIKETFTPANLTTTTLFRRAIFSNVGSGCVSHTFPITFTYVDLDPGSLDNSQNTIICYNEVPAKITIGNSGAEATSNVGTISYAWQQSTDNVNWTVIAAADQSSYSPPALQKSTYFRRSAINRQGSYSCSKTTNPILISVYDELKAGTLLGNQTICQGGVPSPISLSGTTSATGISYLWQMSSDNANFTTIPNTLPTLSFPVTATWFPMSTTYYRSIVRNSSSPGCDVTSNVVEVFVAQSAEIVQLAGPGSQQTVCQGDSITNTTFSLTGSATSLNATGWQGTGLSFTGPVEGIYTLSGTPNVDAAITITADGINPCIDTSYQYQVLITPIPNRPDFIRRDTNTQQNTIFQHGSLWYNNTFCQNTTGPTTTSFFMVEMDPVEGTVNYEWKAEPSSAGTINTTTGVMTWNPFFSGTATISVRALGCTGNSTWLDTKVQIISDSTPAVTASPLSTPGALNLFLGDVRTGVVPQCQITNTTPNTQFFTTTANGVSDYQSIQWSIENVVVGGGITGESNPGTINSSTGVVNWNPNFYGSLDIKAEAVNCEGTVDAFSVTTIQIVGNDNSLPNIITVTPTIIPSCPPQGNYVTSLSSNREVDWEIDNDKAGVIVSTSANSANLIWQNDFSGTVRISASANDTCATGESEVVAIVPGPARIETLPGLDDVQLCQSDVLQGIPYTISGFPSTANVTGLPNGITGTLSATHHIVDIVYSGVPATGQVYRLEVLGQLYEYTTQAGDSADDIVLGLSNSVSALPTSLFYATRNAQNTLRLRPKVAGITLSGTVYFITGYVTGNAQTISSPQREYILSGTLDNVAPGQYDYVITTQGGASFCEQESITGRITVVGTSSLTLDVGSVEEQTICDFSPISSISYTINNANNAVVDGLPPGVTYKASSTRVIISGTPQTNVTNKKVYTFTVSTTNNISGCFPEVARTGTITVMPNHTIQLTSALGTDNQSICNSGAVGNFIPIEYTFGGGSVNPPILSGTLPTGIVSNYNAANNVLTISGTPATIVTTRTTHNYSVTTSGPSCSSITLSGTIIVNPNPKITLLSAASTIDQTAGTAVCNKSPIQNIQYELFESPSFSITGLPNGVLASQLGNNITIEGTPDETINTRQIFTYTLMTNGSTCQPEIITTGQIEVIPVPQINTDYINLNDVTNVRCSGGEDGSIKIPTVAPDLDLRIRGGQSPTAQVEEISLFHFPLLGDEYRITINGIDYTHTVIASSFGGPTQTVSEIRDILVHSINNATGVNESTVTATANATSSIRLSADVAGTAFTFTTNLQTSYTGTSTPTMVSNQIVANVSTNYIYSWSGPNGFTSSNLQIENLSAGEYTLRVTAGSCFSEATFTINEPTPITANNELCNGAFKTTLGGGTAPYALKLFDAFGNLVRSDTTNSIFTYNDLTPGANYRLEVRDANCNIPQQFSVTIPFELQFNAANVALTHDFCQQSPNTGDGSIVLGTSSGNAFTGGSGNFTYRWSGPSGNFITKDIYSLIAGDYTVTVTDNELGCSRSETFTIASNSPLTIALSGSTVLNSNGEIELACTNTASGVIEVNVTGGFGVYTYAWERNGVAIPNSNGNRLENLSAGVYTLTVTDVPPGGIVLSSLCQRSQDFTIVSPPELHLNVDQEDIQQAECSGQLVSIPVEVSGGVPPYTIELNNISISTSSPTYTFSDLDPQTLGETVTITLSDQNSCKADTVSLSIQLPNQHSFDGSTTDIDCSQNTLGTIQLTADPAIPNDNVLIVEWYGDALHFFDTWSNGNGLLNQINNPGTYTVSVTNQAGCVLYSSSFEIEDTSGQQLQVEVIQEISSTSCNENEGRIDLAISNGYPPYTILWQVHSSLNTWTLLPEYNNKAIITGLSSGTYRAIVSDSSSQGTATVECSPTITTRIIELTDQRLELNDFQIENAADLCREVTTGLIRFGLINTLQNTESSSTLSLTFLLDGIEIPKTSNQLTFDELRQTYEITDIEPGIHQLKIIASTASTTCQIEEEFTLMTNANPIVFLGELTYELDVCSSGVNIVVNANDISGGTPFSGVSPYDLNWSYYPNSVSNGTTQTFFGTTINQAQAGVYALTITDANGCTNSEEKPILIEVVAPEFLPISIQGILANPESNQSIPVKSLPIQCESEEGGVIGIEVIGGLRPFEINWFKQNTNIVSSSATYLPLSQYKNQTYLSGLEPGKYRVEIQSLNENCEGNFSIYTSYEEIIEVEQNPDLVIVSGPYIDADICAGNPGRISVEVFNNNQGELIFYYDGELVQEEDNPQVNEQTHTLLIEAPKESATLQIVNSQGCTLTKQLNLALGEPRFSFTSPTFESSNLILARETITFNNLSTTPYVRSEWDFGDFTSPLSILNTATSTKINYSYPVSGAYNVTLRIYNQAGCYLETTQQVAIGKGYSIIVPNVFSPNNDGINDFFRPLTTGLSTIRFSVYDYNGNFIYNENISEPDPNTSTGISIQGWDGRNAPQAPYFIYSVEGLLYDGVTTVEKTGTFILLR